MSEFKLCGKTYAYKMNLASMRAFKKATNKDMWYTLISLIEVYLANSEKPILTQMKSLYEAVDFETGLQLFYTLAKQEDKTLEIEEIEDGMLRVGWRPIEQDGEYIQPYPIILFEIAQNIDAQIVEVVTAKK